MNGFHGGTNNCEKLQEVLKKQLKQKRFLLILDAFCRQNNWDKIKDALPEDSKGLVVLTTRNIDEVPDDLGKKIEIIELNFNTTDSIILFLHMAFNLKSKWDEWVILIMGWFGSLKAKIKEWCYNWVTLLVILLVVGAFGCLYQVARSKLALRKPHQDGSAHSPEANRRISLGSTDQHANSPQSNIPISQSTAGQQAHSPDANRPISQSPTGQHAHSLEADKSIFRSPTDQQAHSPESNRPISHSPSQYAHPLESNRLISQSPAGQHAHSPEADKLIPQSPAGQHSHSLEADKSISQSPIGQHTHSLEANRPISHSPTDQYAHSQESNRPNIYQSPTCQHAHFPKTNKPISQSPTDQHAHSLEGNGPTLNRAWILAIGLNLMYGLSKILSQPVVLEWVLHIYLARKENVPKEMQRNMKNIMFLPIPLAVKFICGALVGGTQDNHTTHEFFEFVLSLSKNKTDAAVAADQRDQDPKPNEHDANKEDIKKLMEVIAHCHQILNTTLHECASDLSILPEGYAINRKRLTRRWVALGLVSPAPRLSSEGVAESYFDELTLRGFIEPESINPCGKIKYFRINSVFREFLNNRGNNCKTSPHDNNYFFQLYDNKQSVVHWLKQLFGENPKFQSLTIVDLEGCKDLRNEHLGWLCECVKLKFLSVRNTIVSMLPENIRKLDHLETLDIRQTRIEKVPESIIDLHGLKHLFAGSIDKPESGTRDLKLSIRATEIPAGMKEMSNLQSLAYVKATKASKLLHSVQQLTQLKKLGLVIDQNIPNYRPLCVSLMMLRSSLHSLSVIDEHDKSSLEFLEYLCLPPLRLESLTLKGYLGRLPQWIGHHKRLTKLVIEDTRLSSDAIRSIGKIPTLLCLKLYNNSFQERDLTLENKEFPVLRVLIIHCDAIDKVWFKKGTAPRLEVFKWVLSEDVPKKFDGINDLLMLKQVSLIGGVTGVHPELLKNMNDTVKNHPNHNSTLVFEKIETKKDQKEENKPDFSNSQSEVISYGSRSMA